VVFGLLVWLLAGGAYAGEFFSGYLTEYSLSVDNLFVFLVIMSSFKVPVIHQHRVLLIGILIALVLRSVLIMAGSLVISKFFAIFYLFGAFLIFTAYRMARSYDKHDEDMYSENVVLRWLRKVVPVTKDYRGSRSFIRENGKRAVTPMLVVIVAIGTTDLLFALDSIPAVFGLTQQPFLVFAVNAFALMGLRQLYFLIGGLLSKLVYLPIGLAVLLMFIGAKLILEVLHTDSLPFVPGNQSLAVPVISTTVSLIVVVSVLLVTKKVLGLQLGDPGLAHDVYTDIRYQVIGAPERWQSVSVSVALSPQTNGSDSSSGAMFLATVRWEYRTIPASPTVRFASVTDPVEYRELLRDPAVASADLRRSTERLARRTSWSSSRRTAGCWRSAGPPVPAPRPTAQPSRLTSPAPKSPFRAPTVSWSSNVVICSTSTYRGRPRAWTSNWPMAATAPGRSTPWTSSLAPSRPACCRPRSQTRHRPWS
jgi:tellurite resistance protein TerC